MKRAFTFLILCCICVIQYGQIIADHAVVADFDKIPPYYLGEVKKMMVGFFGESHSAAYRTGMELLESSSPDYQCNISTGEGYTDQYLRVNYEVWTGEDVWYTWYAFPVGSRPSTSNTIKNTIKLYSDQGHPLSVIGFGWCWDMLGYNISSTIDPVYGCHWYGWSAGGPEGNLSWGLDASDYSITENSVSMDTYINATEDYISYCNANSYGTKIVFTTGPVDTYYAGESGYQGSLKNGYIRNYVRNNPSKVLFDYADILCYDDDGNLTTSSWNGHIYPSITTINSGDASIGHIGSAGAIRLAKAQWWLLARMAGWDGTTSKINVSAITVTGAAGATTITSDNGTLQLSAAVSPANATDKSVTWSITNGTGEATVNATGLVTAVNNGTVTARATANDGSAVFGTLVITISNQVIPVSAITVTGAAGATTITSDNGTLQLSAAVSPANATDKSVTWSITNGTGEATVNATGLVTAVNNGTVTARATANDGSAVFGTLVITISNQTGTTGINLSGRKTEPLIIITNRNEIKILLTDNYMSWKADLYSIHGILVRSKFVESNIFVFDVSSLSSGLYIIILSNKDNRRVAKVIRP